MIDRYTKVCLTVIAVSLAVIGLRGLPMIDPAWAQGGVQKIAICDQDGRQCAGVGEKWEGREATGLYVFNWGR